MTAIRDIQDRWFKRLLVVGTVYSQAVVRKQEIKDRITAKYPHDIDALEKSLAVSPGYADAKNDIFNAAHEIQACNAMIQALELRIRQTAGNSVE